MNTLERSSSPQQDDDKSESRSSKVNDTRTTISYPLPNNIIAIFKVRFHVHRGNELVWQYPPDIDLQGVEYQLICSGLHLVEKDTIYFSRWNGIGVGVFENRETDHDRGANMQAIGVLIALPSANIHPDPLNLWQHVSFLEEQLARTLDDDNPADPKEEYNQLEDYYHAHKYQPVTTQPLHDYITPVPLNTRYFQPFESVPYALSYYIESSVFPLSSERLQQQQQKQWHTQDPTRAFSDMVQALGPSAFTLWKAILLKQRILMMKPTPPMEQLCHFAYNAYLMDQWQSLATPHIQSHMALKFNIGINDINQLEKRHPAESSYIACTSDTIFDFKKDLYDVMIKFPPNTTNAIVTPSSPISVNAADHVRYNLLMYLFPTTHQASPSTSSCSSWAYYRYDWITRWEALTRRSNQQPLSVQRTQRYPLHQQPTQASSNNSNNSNNSGTGSMHMLEDTAFSTSAAAPLITPSALPRTSSQELLVGDQVILDDTTDLLTTTTTNNNHKAKARALVSNSGPDQPLALGNAPSAIPDTLNNTLLGFFHVLTLQLISALQTLVEDQGQDQDEVVLGIQDMVRLGLDPWDDRYLVEQLGMIYFNKRISVSACHDVCSCCSCCTDGAPIQL